MSGLSTNKIHPACTVIVDAFRAFATASYVLSQNPKRYYLTNRCHVLEELSGQCENKLMIGKPEKGSFLCYDIPNSPTRAKECTIKDTTILHRTEAGAKGILDAYKSDIILAVSFVNLHATAKYLKQLGILNPKIIPMGHEAVTPTLEDDLCAQFLSKLLKGKEVHISPYIPDFKEGSGRYFFLEDQKQYPQEDFDYCLNSKVDFAIKAQVEKGYACLKAVKN